MLKFNSDHRGIFCELFKKSYIWEKSPLCNIRQISYLTINKGCWRGGHYHLDKENVEGFILLTGDCELFECWSKDEKPAEVFDGHKKELKLYELYEVQPTIQHTLFSKNGATLLVLSAKEFDPTKPDTHILSYETE